MGGQSLGGWVCGRNNGHGSLWQFLRGELSLADAADGEGEAHSERLVSLADSSKCLSTVVLGNAGGKGDKAAFQKQVMLRGGRKCCISAALDPANSKLPL